MGNGTWAIRRGALATGAISLVAVALSFAVGAAFVAAISALIAAACLLWRRFRRRDVLFCLATILLFSGSLAVRQAMLRPVLATAGERDAVTAQVVDTPMSGHFYTVRVVTAERLPAGTGLLLYSNEQNAPTRGDVIAAQVELRALYPSQSYAMADGAFLQAYPTAFGEDVFSVVSSGDDLFVSRLRPVRDHLAAQMRRHLGKDIAALIEAMCLGKKDALSAAVRQDFRACGLPHLLAVSGLHLTVVIGALYALLRRFLRRLAAPLTIAATVLYMWLIEFTPSVTRAGAMLVVLLAGQLTRYRADSLNSLGLAMTLLLAADPYALYDVGLQLSFAATAGILVLLPAFARRRERRGVRRLIRESLAVTFAASLYTLPLMAVSFGNISLLTPLANLLAVLPAEGLLIVANIALLIGLLPGGFWVARGLYWLVGQAARYLLWLTDRLAAIPGALHPIGGAWEIAFWIGAAALMTLAMLRADKHLRRRVCLFLLTLFVAAQAVSVVLDRRYTTVSLYADKSAVILVQYGDHGLLLVRDAADLIAARADWEETGCRRMDFLLTEQGTTADAAALAALAEDYAPTVAVRGETTWLPPTATNCLRVGDGDTLALWNGASLTALPGGWWRLQIGDSRLLLAPAAADAAVLPETETCADGLVISGRMVYNGEKLSVGRVFWLQTRRADDPPDVNRPLIPVGRDGCRIRTAGKQDWSESKCR